MIETGQAWATAKAADLPKRWESRIMARWHRQRQAPEGGFSSQGGAPIWFDAEGLANIALRGTVESLAVVRLPLDASDSDICQAADALAQKCSQLALATLTGAERTKDAAGRWVMGQAMEPKPLLGTVALQRAAMGRIALGHGIKPPIENEGKSNHVEDGPAIARMQDAQWWRRKLRGVHAKHVEGAAIDLGYVNKKADPYVSNESVWRRAQQNERNSEALEATTATNEEGDEFTLAELAAKGPANKAIRRAELMTRIAGFEKIADDMGHVGMFFTMTCPSRMHKWRTTRTGAVIENPKYDGTLPNEAQQHLAKTWARIRASLARRGLHQYGFRIAEPNHDGTPHWHVLVFFDPRYKGTSARDAVRRFCALVRRYALGTGADRTERGAKQHRCDFKPIDKGRGSAAGYIAKYVAKNIDGYRLDKDLIGNDAVETSHRVEAWASTWRIRQFQQVGGPPVGPWRELRRVTADSIPANAPGILRQAYDAVNSTKYLDNLSEKQSEHQRGAAWNEYVYSQGGPACGRNYPIRVMKADPEGKNKYGEENAPRIIGIELVTNEQIDTTWRVTDCKEKVFQSIEWLVHSARKVWTIAKKTAQAIGRVSTGLKAQPLTPWTCVNNCTGATNDRAANGAKSDPRIDRTGAYSVAKSPGAHQSNGRGLCGPNHGGDFGYQWGT